MYLPATFMYKDLKNCAFKDSILEKYYPTPDFQQAFRHNSTGNYVMKYSMGQAIAMAPWFFIADTYARLSNYYPRDGFSKPYQFCISLGTFLYGLIGLFVLRKILLFAFSESTVSTLLIIYTVGTNLLSYIAIDSAMTHGTLFAIYAILIFTATRFYKKPSIPKGALMGFLCGLAMLIRPTEIISVLVPLLWGISNFRELKERVFVLKKQLPAIVIFALCLVAVVSLQLYYWKYVSGKWMVYSYQDQSFYWTRPHVWDYCFSYRCGWLTYCPMMILAIVGVIPFLFRKKNIVGVLPLLFLSFYLVTAWDIWDYGGSSGRAMVQYYPLLAFPSAQLIEDVNRKRIWQILFYSLVFLFAYVNIWFTYNAHRGEVQVSWLTQEYYWKMIGRWQESKYDKQLLDNEFSFDGEPRKATLVYKTEDTTILDNDHQYSKEYIIARNDHLHKWIRANAIVHIETKEWDQWRQAHFILDFYNGNVKVQSSYIRIQRFLDDRQTKRVFIDAISPSTEWDTIRVLFWNGNSDKKLFIYSLDVISFDE